MRVVGPREVARDGGGHAAQPADVPRPARVARLSYFFPAHNEEANLAGLVEEALDGPADAGRRRSRSSPSTTARATAPASIADELTAAHPGIVRAVHHPTNLGYGAALRSGFRAARYDLVAFTDGDRQFQVADLGRLTARLAAADAPGRRRRLPDQARRPAHPHDLRQGLPAGQPDLLRPAGHRRRLRLQALPARGPRGPAGRVGRGVLLGRAAHQAARRRARRSSRSACPHYPRTAGSPTGAKPQVILRAVRDFWRLRLRMWVEPRPRPAARRADPRRDGER